MGQRLAHILKGRAKENLPSMVGEWRWSNLQGAYLLCIRLNIPANRLILGTVCI
jgi:hypothetical protein